MKGPQVLKTAKLLTSMAAAAALLLTGCGGSGSNAQLKVGIINYVSHTALDAVQKGFIDGLAEAGYKDQEKIALEIQNPQADQSTLGAIATQYGQDGKDLVLAIATPAAQAAAQAITDKPVLFGAVTDPVGAGLVASLEAPGGNVTGASDLNPVENQIKLIKEIKPEAKTLGVVYASGEANSEVQVKAAEEAAVAQGLEIKKTAIVNSSEIQQAAESLEVDAFYVPTDNVVVSGLEGLIQVAETKGAVVVASDEGSVQRGSAASYTVNYEKQGRDLAAMAVKIFEGAKPADLPVGTQDSFDLCVNEAAATRQGATLPVALVERAIKKF